MLSELLIGLTSECAIGMPRNIQGGSVSMGISNNTFLRAFKGLYYSPPITPVLLSIGGPQRALRTPNANLIGCSCVPEPNKWPPKILRNNWTVTHGYQEPVVFSVTIASLQNLPPVSKFAEVQKGTKMSQRIGAFSDGDYVLPKYKVLHGIEGFFSGDGVFERCMSN